MATLCSYSHLTFCLWSLLNNSLFRAKVWNAMCEWMRFRCWSSMKNHTQWTYTILCTLCIMCILISTSPQFHTDRRKLIRMTFNAGWRLTHSYESVRFCLFPIFFSTSPTCWVCVLWSCDWIIYRARSRSEIV